MENQELISEIFFQEELEGHLSVVYAGACVITDPRVSSNSLLSHIPFFFFSFSLSRLQTSDDAHDYFPSPVPALCDACFKFQIEIKKKQTKTRPHLTAIDEYNKRLFRDQNWSPSLNIDRHFLSTTNYISNLFCRVLKVPQRFFASKASPNSIFFNRQQQPSSLFSHSSLICKDCINRPFNLKKGPLEG